MHCIPPCTVLLLVALAAAALAADIPRPEHPRPQFQRDLWLNLNGEWQFEEDPQGDGEARGLSSGADLAQRILVPFCPESKLSGLGKADFMTHVWYRRQFEVPDTMRGRRLLLHFEAVDWEARVWVNGQFVGSHQGGYSPFWLDITDAVRDGENEIVLHARDDTRSGLQATGKQSHKLESYGCVYTRTTGIWQTVWLEAVGETWLREFTLTPDPDNEQLLFHGWVQGPQQGRTVRLEALDGGRRVAEARVPASWRSTYATLRIETPTLWHPGQPHLYDLKITVEEGGEPIDTVNTYFGLRKVHLDGNRFLINDQPVFQRLVLDQGFYPDGIYTAPSDEALKRDIELSLAAGFNGARLHEKVFEPRLLYWADRLGYLLWGEYPNWGLDHDNAAAVGQMVLEWQEVLRRDRNHPAIIGWCPLNETGGGEGNALAQALLGVTQMIDPSRPFLDASGYTHLYAATDIYDSHNYTQDPSAFKSLFTVFDLTGDSPYNNNLSDTRSAYRGQPYFVSEYGGTRLARAEDDQGAWGYGAATGNVEEFLARYKALTDALMDNPNMFGFCYTQLTDIEQEQNGVYFYDRSPKYDPALLNKLNSRPAAYETAGPRRMSLNVIVPTSREQPQTWRYTLEAPADEWTRPDFDDGGWREAPGGFGKEDTPGAVIGTKWETDDIWLRRTFEIAKADFGVAFLDVHHDEDAEVYLNGELLAGFREYTTGYILENVTEALRAALREGENTLAVHCHQTVGGQFIDAGLQFGAQTRPE